MSEEMQFNSLLRQETFLSSKASRAVLSQPPIQSAVGALCLGVRQPQLQTDHLPPSGAEINNDSSYTFHSIRLHVMQGDNFNFRKYRSANQLHNKASGVTYHYMILFMSFYGFTNHTFDCVHGNFVCSFLGANPYLILLHLECETHFTPRFV